MAEYKQMNIFGELEDIDIEKKGKRAKTFEDYEGFVKKFEAKKTTDDCYTPPTIYEIVKDWTVKRFGLNGAKIIRPFKPGGDFINEDYSGDCVVIDNPPFSILKKICDFYNARGIRFFLFCPGLTSICKGCTFVAVAGQITYENGANVNTCFVTNLAGDLIAMTAPDLSKSLNEENNRLSKLNKKVLSKVAYPPQVLRAFGLQSLARYGVHYEVRASEGAVRSKVCDYNAFGSSVLLSDEATEKRIKAEEDARRVKFEEIRAEKTTLQLSQTDRNIINSLNKNTKHD